MSQSDVEPQRLVPKVFPLALLKSLGIDTNVPGRPRRVDPPMTAGRCSSKIPFETCVLRALRVCFGDENIRHCVRLRPGGRPRRSPSSGCSRDVLASARGGQVPEPFHGSNARQGARPSGSARSDNRIIIQQCCQHLGVCKSAGERTTGRS